MTAHYAVEGQGLYGLPLSESLPVLPSRGRGIRSSPCSGSRPRGSGPGLYVAPHARRARAEAAGGGRVVLAGQPRRDRRRLVRRRVAGDQPHDRRRRRGISGSAIRATSTSTSAVSGRSTCSSGCCSGSRSCCAVSGRRCRQRQTPLAAVPRGGRDGRDRAPVRRRAACTGSNTHISIMEYWRWWVVHLWVEGVFEVFATAIVSALLVRMGLVRISVATTSVLVATIIFLGGGVLGTFHHLYLERNANRRDRARQRVFGARGRAAGRRRASKRIAARSTKASSIGRRRITGRSCSSARCSSGT